MSVRIYLAIAEDKLRRIDAIRAHAQQDHTNQISRQVIINKAIDQYIAREEKKNV